jgi:hypothetical protein
MQAVWTCQGAGSLGTLGDMMKILKSNGLPIALLLAGILFLSRAWFAHAGAKRMEADGVTVPGFIEKGEVRKGRRFTDYYLYVSFKAPNGRYQKQAEVSADFYNDHVNSQGKAVVPKVEVRYVPPDTNEIEVVGGSMTGFLHSPPQLAIGGSLCLVGGIGYFLYLKQRGKLQSP